MDAGSVGIVVVSHSRALARAAVALAARDAARPHGPRIEVAAGLDETTFGTDAVQIKDAIERVDGPDGVVVLMDLGSAVLSAELALDLLDDPATPRPGGPLAPAPIVEGLSSPPSPRRAAPAAAEVAAEARGALMGKAAHLSAPSRGRRRRAAASRRGEGRRRLHRHQRAWAARPAGGPAGRRGPPKNTSNEIEGKASHATRRSWWEEYRSQSSLSLLPRSLSLSPRSP